MKEICYWVPLENGRERDYPSYFDNWEEVKELRNYIVSHKYRFVIIEDSPPDWIGY